MGIMSYSRHKRGKLSTLGSSPTESALEDQFPQHAGDIDPAHHPHCDVRHKRLDGRGSANRSNHFLKHSSSQVV